MRFPLRATVLVGLLALATVFYQPVHAAGPATKIILDPASVTINADQTQTFKVMAVAADGTSTDVTSQSTLSVNDPIGKISGAVYTPGKVGTWTVQAAYQSFTTTATATITPGAVKEVIVNPSSEPEQTYIGTNTKFTATVYDGKNNIVPNQQVVWTAIGENGTINDQGVFTPTKVGTGKVQAAVGTIIGQTTVVVNPAVVTNTNTVVAKPRNTNATTNTNVSNTNTVTNTAITPVSATSSNQTTTTCTTLKPWVWIALLIVFLIAVAVLFALVPVTAIWPVVLALVAAAILSFVQRKYDCNGQTWWAFVVMLGTIALASAALMMRPKKSVSV